MIFRLEIENFYSLWEPQTIDLVVARNAPDGEKRFESIHAGSPDRAPKVVALFGANASGKSNVLRALSFLSWFVQGSFLLPPLATLLNRGRQAFNLASDSGPTKPGRGLPGFACTLPVRSNFSNRETNGISFAVTHMKLPLKASSESLGR